MRLQTRLLLLGVAGPTVALVATTTIAAMAFRRELESDLDRRLLAQAAVESVSLFDTPTREPHLHVAASPLVQRVRAFAPHTMLYDARGDLIVKYPSDAHASTTWRQDASLEPRLETIGSRRQLSVRVLGPEGAPYVLVLSAEMIHIDTSIERFSRAAGVGGIIVLGIVAAWVIFAVRRLRMRVEALARPIADAEFSRNVAGGDELDEVRAQLVRAQQEERKVLAARERLIANAAHQLKTPLSVLRTELELALRRSRSQEEQNEILRNVQGEVERLSTLAHALLAYEAVQLQALPNEYFEAAPILAAVVEKVAIRAREKSITVTHTSERGLWVRGSMTWLEQALLNLVDNAVCYSPKHTQVDVSAQRVLAGDAAFISIRVRDQGPGLTGDERVRVFEPFVRLNREVVPGSGLGLSIAAEVARKHGGSLTLEDGNEGSVFCLLLPEAKKN